MDLLDFARGPALALSVAVFVLGTAWRLAGVLRLPARPELSPRRPGADSRWAAATGSVLRGLWPQRRFGPVALVSAVNGWLFHIGLALVALAYAPHIEFVRRHTGLHWPALPDAVMYLAAGVTMVALLFAAWQRLNDPVLRLISRPDDWISWTVTFLPFATGMAVIGEPSAALLARDAVLYRGPLALHLLSLELLLLWFPFGKLMHAVLYGFSRAATGARLGHRGVRA